MKKDLGLSKKQIKRLIISQQDIFAACSYINQLLKHRYHDPDYLDNIEEFSNSDEYVNMEALTIAFIISYSRPFIDNDGETTATPSLPQKSIRSLNVEEKKLHHEIIAKRNKAVAHSDADLYDAHISMLEGGKCISPCVMASPIIFFTRNELLLIAVMIDKIINYMGDALNSLIMYHGEDFYKYLVNKMED